MANNILIVDDMREVADTKMLVIQKLGGGDFNAEAVYGGKACLDRLTKSPKIDLILLDMDMPEVNGADVIRALLKMENPPAKILPMTAWGPGWIRHWNLTELSQTPAFQHWVWAETYDKATDSEEMLTLIRRAIGAKEGN